MPVLFPISLLFTMKSDLGPLSEIDEKLSQLGMKLRLTGRDMMRLGGAMEQTFGSLLGQITKVLGGSMLWEAGLEDISWALEDVGSVIGDTLAPFLDIIVGLIESFADALEKSPLLVWLTILVIAGVALGVLAGMLLKAAGSFNIFIGTVLVAGKAHLGLGTSIKALMIGMTEGLGPMKAYIAAQKGLGTGGTEINKTLKGLEPRTRAVVANLYEVEDAFYDSLGKPQGKAATSLGGKVKGLGKSMKNFGKDTKGTAMPLMGLASVFGIFLGLMFAAEPIMELFQSVTEALEPALDVIATTFEPIIEFISSWIEENPLLAAGILAAIVAIFILLGTAGLLTSFFSGILGFLKIAPAMMPVLSTNITIMAGAIIKLALAIGILVLSFAAAIWILSQTGFSIPEILALMWNLVAVVTALTGVMIIFAIALSTSGAVLAPLTPILAILAVLILAVGVAVMLAGLGFMMMGMGVLFACAGLLMLVGYIPQLLMLVPILFGIALGMGALALAGILAVGPILALSFALGLLALAIFALATAFLFLSSIGLGHVAKAMGESLVTSIVPRLAEGGIIAAGGIAYLHPGEEVRSAEVTKKGKVEPTSPTIIQINAPIGSKEIAQAFADEIEKIMDRKNKRSR